MFERWVTSCIQLLSGRLILALVTRVLMWLLALVIRVLMWLNGSDKAAATWLTYSRCARTETRPFIEG